MVMTRRVLSAWFLAAASIAMLACSEGEPVHETSTTSGGDGASGGAGGSVAEGTGGAGGDMTPDPGPEVCPNATGVYDVKPAQTNLLFLLDRSGSMHLRVQGDDTRWSLTTAGLSSILAALPQSTVAGLEMFPSGDQPVSCCAITSGNYIDCGACGAGELPGPGSRCSTVVYGDFSVDMAALSSGHAGEITAAAQSSNDEFYWGTPLAPALGGTISGLSSYQLPGVTSIVLLTDGLPTSCETSSDPNANDVARALAAATVGAQNGIRTYVVGIDADAASSDPTTDLAINLSAVAQAGGTGRYAGCEQNDDCAYVVNSDNFEQALADALGDIALEATSCSIELPDVQGGMPDYDAVNITVTSAGQTTTVPRDASKQDGWDYLPGNQQVQLYGEACEVLKNDAQAKVTVVVGCKTEQI
jgi:hypothetical protein